MDLDAYFGHKAEAPGYKSGFVALVGRPNAGKSTLLNRLLGQKVAIVSDKPQTTRTKIQGIYTDDTMQAVFFDTPGIHKPAHKLGEYMNKAAEVTFGDVDIICYLADAALPFGGGEAFICKALAGVKTPVFMVLNKCDLLTEEQLAQAGDVYAEKLPFARILAVSALTGSGVEELLDAVREYLPEGPKYFDGEEITDQPERQIMAEIIREQVFLNTREEIPHSAAVQLTQYQRRDNGMLYLEAFIYVERDSQKGIVIGKGGQMLKKIGAAARAEIESLFDEQVFLELRVKTKPDWRDDKRLLKAFGYDEKQL